MKTRRQSLQEVRLFVDYIRLDVTTIILDVASLHEVFGICYSEF